MSWLHRLQQRLSITKNEAMTLLSLSLFLVLGTVGRYACRQVRPVSAEYYAEIDSLFAERSAAVLEPSGSEGRDEPQSHGSAARQSGDVSADSSATRQPRLDSGADLVDSDAVKNAAGKHDSPRPLNIDINSATIQELQLLPRVGPRTAERIIAFRKEYGSFRSVDELLSVSGIGPKTLQRIHPHVYVKQDSTR